MLHRRDAMLRLGRVGLGAVTLPELLRWESSRWARGAGGEAPGPGAGGPARRSGGRAKSCILIYLWGGPPQQDMWDMKPDSATGIRSQFATIPTVVPGIDFCEHLPLLARHTDKVTLVRSVTHPSNNHEPSVYRTLTGRINNTLAVPRNQRNRNDFPNLGSVVSWFTPPGGMPAAVTIPRPIGHDGVTYSGTHGGFLGGRHDPMETAAAEETPEKPTHPIAPQAELVEARLLARRGLLGTLEDLDRRFQQERTAQSIDSYREQGFSMLTSPQAKRAFRLDLETPATRERYGTGKGAQSVLLARRLVEAGVRMVFVNWPREPGDLRAPNPLWDTHAHNNPRMKDVLCPQFDQGFTALIEDLATRGLLESTLVVAVGEMGRTPKFNGSGGRDHWGNVFSFVMAGAGLNGGQVHGASDATGAFPARDRVTPPEFTATLLHLLGIGHEALFPDRTGRPLRATEGEPLWSLL